MIRSLKSDNPHFKSVFFKPGFNIILAERTEESTKKDSRNGLGKSTLIEIIHFCLGGNKGETLSKSNLDNWNFSLELDIGNKKFSFIRNTTDQNKIFVEGDCSGWPIEPKIDPVSNRKFYPQSSHSPIFNRVLGEVMFNLRSSEQDLVYSPTFRSLISYFARKNGQSGAFLNPFKHFSTQHEWDIQTNNAFLLDLDWKYASKWQVLKDRKNVLDQIKQEAEAGVIANLIGSIGELESKKVRLFSQIQESEKEIKEFKVHPQYHKLEREIREVNKAIHMAINLSINDKRLLDHYENSLKEEKEAQPETIINMYKEMGLTFPEIVRERMDDVLAFNKKVVVNRKGFLKSEIVRLKDLISKRESDTKIKISQKEELMKVLETHGAVEEYTQLKNIQQQKVAELKDLEIRLETLKKFEQGRSSLTVETELLQRDADSDMNERKEMISKAILLFNSNSTALYEAPGTLSVDVSKTGYKFKVNIERSSSHGISNMKIFCYDLMLAQLWSKKEKSPGFLIHDSLLFADVDERQVASALELAKKESESKGFQYICAMNSDSIPTGDLSEDFNLKEYVILTLTDRGEDTGLLGIRF